MTLREIADVITKGTTPTTLGYDFQDEGINFLKIECFDEAGNYLGNCAHISEECNEKLSRSKLQENDILFSIAGAIGRVAIVTEDLLPANTNQALAIIRISGDEVYLPYIKLILQSGIVRRQFEKQKQGVAQLNLSLKNIGDLIIPLFSKERQMEFVELFSKVQVLIDNRRSQLVELDTLIKARFVEMFGDPIQNEKNWSRRSLEQLCHSIVDCPHSTPNYISEDTGFMCIRTSVVKKNKILWDEIEYIVEDEFNQRIQRKRPEKGDIVYTREGAILGIAAIIDRNCNVALGQRSMLLSPDSSVCTSEFICTAMNSDSFLSNALRGISGSASPHINVGDIKSFEMIAPPLELQRKFSEFNSQVDKLKFVKLKDVCNINMGQSPDSDSYNDNEDGIPFFQGNADFGEKYPTTRKWCNAPTKIAHAEDILISVRAPIGALNYAKEECCIGRGLAAITPNQDKVSSGFIYWLLKGKHKELNLQGTGSTFKAISRKVLEEIKVPDIELKKQTELAGSLEKVYSVIQLRKQQLEELDILIKARFVEMFGDPIQNEKGWDIVTFKDCLNSIENGKSFICEANVRTGNNPAILKLSAVTYGVYNPDENKAIINSEDFVEAAAVHSGDLLFTRKNTPELVGMAAYVSETPEKLMMPDLVFRLNTNNNCNKIFLWQLINHDRFRGKIKKIASGSAKSMSNISKERLGALEMYLPPMDLQNEFVAFVIQVDKLKFVETIARF